MSSITGKVTRTERAGASYYGNPAFKVAIEDETGDIHLHRTSSNVMLAYAINNPEYRDEPHTFHLTRAGRITHATEVEE